MSTKYTAIFQPEAWQRNQAIPVDPEGPTTWDCTAAVNQRPHYFTRLLARKDEPIDVDDYLKHDPAAPQWIRSWAGPFTIRVTRFDVDMHIAEKCAHCHLFIEDQSGYADALLPEVEIARYVHLTRGDEADEAIDATHDAEPSGLRATIAAWKLFGPLQMRERFVPDDFDPIHDVPPPDAVGVALLAGETWELAKTRSRQP